MSSPSSAPENSCRITLGQAQQVRPKVPLLRILQAAGAQGDTFTLKEVMHFLGQYIMARQLYDKREQHLVHCGGDALGELLGLQSFSVKDPSPVYEMLKRNLTAASVPTDAAQTLPTEPNAAQPLRDRPQEEGSDSGIAEGDGKTSVLGASGSKCEDQDSLENLGNNPRPSLELALDDWDVSGLPWWFLGNLRNNYNSRSNGSTDIQTNQDMDTAIVSDTTDDLWFLSERPSEPGNAGNRTEPEELPEGDPEVPEAAPLEELEDSQSLSDDTDTETPSQERWQCCKCRRFNSPGKRYCYRCWALRRDWYHDCPKLPHSLSLPCLDPTKTPQREKERGVDVPDCRRTISAPAGQPAHLFAENPKSCPDPSGSVESLDLALREKRDFPDPTNPEGTESPSDSVRTLLSPCFLCQLRPRDGNIVHGRTAHLVACFRCARMLKRKGSPCPVCRKEIRMVIRIFMG